MKPTYCRNCGQAIIKSWLLMGWKHCDTGAIVCYRNGSPGPPNYKATPAPEGHML
jgi:hypothetical protein